MFFKKSSDQNSGIEDVIWHDRDHNVILVRILQNWAEERRRFDRGEDNDDVSINN